VTVEVDLDTPVAVGPVDLGARLAKPAERRGRGVAVAVLRADRDDGDLGSNGRQERGRRRGRAAVVRDLQQIDLGQSVCQQDGVDLLLDVAGQEHALCPERAEKHDRDVIDRCPVVAGLVRNGATVRPQNAEIEIVEGQTVAGCQPSRRGTRRTKSRFERPVPRPRSAHSRLVHGADAKSLDEGRQSGGVILVGMRQYDDVDATVPRWQMPIESREQPRRVRSAVEQHS
jgi:hypothetical protein